MIDADGPYRLALFELAVDSMRDVLSGLAGELSRLRAPWDVEDPPSGAVARRMHDACAIAGGRFVTPMAAVAGAIADHVLATMMTGSHAATATKISVNNGGDIAFWTGAGATTRPLSPARCMAVSRLPGRRSGAVLRHPAMAGAACPQESPTA